MEKGKIEVEWKILYERHRNGVGEYDQTGFSRIDNYGLPPH